jgi:hypothetical protein
VVAYTVYPFKTSGVAPVFIYIEQADNPAAASEALKLLEQHSSAARVTVWREDQVIFSGLSSACAAWLAEAPRRLEHCPALSAPEQSCPPTCGRFAARKP